MEGEVDADGPADAAPAAIAAAARARFESIGVVVNLG
ncbi:MAG: hypothetical protein ACJA2W_000766 [Planctomycetota bacterium]|jgi:hypothetical protein